MVSERGKLKVSNKENGNNRSREGYAKQREHVQRIIDASRGMSSVNHEDSKGRPITSGKDVREGPDGGIDLVTNIEAKNRQALSRVQRIFDEKLRK
jgi:hypothetical protein